MSALSLPLDQLNTMTLAIEDRCQKIAVDPSFSPAEKAEAVRVATLFRNTVTEREMAHLAPPQLKRGTHVANDHPFKGA